MDRLDPWARGNQKVHTQEGTQVCACEAERVGSAEYGRNLTLEAPTNDKIAKKKKSKRRSSRKSGLHHSLSSKFCSLCAGG